jgi:hypothetical protein
MRLSLVGGIVLLGVVPPSASAGPIEMSRFTCEFRGKQDSFRVVAARPGAEVFRIRSVYGINGATITCHEGVWPESISIHFVGLRGLESFDIEGNGVVLGASLAPGVNPSVYFFNERGEHLPDEKGSVYRLTIEARKDEGIRVTLTPPPTARSAKTWKLNWIDVYRR